MANAFDDNLYQGKVRGGRFYPRVKSRFEQLAQNNLGIINMRGYEKRMMVRNETLDLLDKYYESCQYDHLAEWDQGCSDDYVAVRQRKPRIIYNFARLLSARVTSKLVGHGNYPMLSIEDDPDTTEFLKVIQKTALLQPRLMEPIRRCVNMGSVFVRFQIEGPVFKIEWYNSKFCYPVFDATGELDTLEVKYVYEDENDRDSKGMAKKKWYRMQLTKTVDTMFDNPEYIPGTQPSFQIVSEVQHDLGFVQGEWFRTSEEKFSPDGYGLSSDIMDFIDEINYSLSQSSQSVSYNQDPQTLINGMDEDEVTQLIKSSSKAWNLGKEGKAAFLESGLAGVQRAVELRDKVRRDIQDIARVVMLDPDKIVGSAQSAKAMEVLHGPFVELVRELQPMIEKSLVALILKMAFTVLTLESRGIDGPVTIPAGYQPKSLDVTVDWPPIFPLTVADLKEMVSMVSAATSTNLLSREWGTRWLSKIKEFGVDDVEAELQRVATQPVINPFGGF